MQKTEQYSDEEAQRRFEAALRGAFKAPPMPVEKTPAKPKAQQKRKPVKASS